MSKVVQHHRFFPRSRFGAVALAAIVVVTMAATTPRHARARSYTSNELAKLHYNKAEVYFRIGDFKRALEHYRLALKSRRLPAFLFNIAQCYRHLNNFERAIFYYELYLSDAPNAPNKVSVLALIAKYKIELKKQQAIARQNRPGSLRIRSTPPGADVFLDDKTKAVGRTPFTMKVTPGRHILTFRRAGHDDAFRTVRVQPGRELAVEAALVKNGPARLSPPRRRRIPAGVKPPGPPDSKRGLPPWKSGWAVTGYVMTAVLTLTAVATGSLTLVKASQYSRMYASDPEASALRKTTLALRTTTDVMIGGAVLSAVVTLAAVLVAQKRWKLAGQEAPATPDKPAVVPARPRVTITPSCSPTGCQLGISGRF